MSSCDEATPCAAPARCETTKRCVPLELVKEPEIEIDHDYDFDM